jgi:hypothetical protein
MELEQPLSRYLHIHQNVVLPNHVNRDGRQYSALWAISRQTRLDMVTVHSLSTNETGHNLGCFSWVVFGLDAAMDFDWARSMEIRIGCVTDCCVNDMDDMGTWENLESLTIKFDKNFGIAESHVRELANDVLLAHLNAGHTDFKLAITRSSSTAPNKSR